MIDGHSFAHRAYHALPKTIRRRGNKGAGAILGFANYLLRFYSDESPAPSSSPGIRWMRRPTGTRPSRLSGGRVFDDELVDQLEVLP